MISCETFRARFEPATEDAALLEHLRSCDGCLDVAVRTDPDVMFRALGGGEMTPPGGLDAFVDDVMRQVRVRSAERTVAQPAHHHSRVSGLVVLTRRLAVAATVAAGITGAVLFYRASSPAPALMQPVARQAMAARADAVQLVSKSVIESYDSDNATILEVPVSGPDDVKIVMIFDENLPADL